MYKNNNLLIVNPALSKEWHLTRNGSLTPNDFTSGSGKKVWWICSKGHEWQAVIDNRSNGGGCPYCSNRKACKDNCLQTVNLTLAKEWHHFKNGNLSPSNVTPFSDKKVWWICSKRHEWQSRISVRSRSSGCPYCKGKKVYKGNCLQTINPKLANEWHPRKNGALTPLSVVAGSNKKAWWICSKGHEWKAVISSRNSGVGCPYCVGKKVSKDNCLKTKNPELAKEWHPIINGDLTPSDVVPNSGKKVWWLCNKRHEWKALISNRNKGRGCPYCSNKKVCEDNCLQTVNPGLAKEWHPTKNRDLTPSDVVPNSGIKVWWICKKGHEWKVSVDNRSNGTGCPYCTTQTSRLELRICSEMKHIFGEVIHRKKIDGHECDLFIPVINTAIEVDGLYWHGGKYQSDKSKTEILKSKNIVLIRVREVGLERVSDNDIFFESSNPYDDFNVLSSLAINILELSKMNRYYKEIIKNYIKDQIFANEEEYLKLLEILPSPLPGSSLADLNIDKAREWHPTKNGYLTPYDVKPQTNMKVWWKCIRGHEWKTSPNSRVNQNVGCPYCSNKKVCEDNCLQTVNPGLAKEWHPTKNGDLTPSDVVPNSGIKVWWICSKGHEWITSIDKRSQGTRCPYCANKKVCKDNCLQTVNPGLAKEWHPTKNGDLTPSDVVPNSVRKVWWKCVKGHEWKNTVYDRSKGRNCPYCLGKVACKDNCLQTVNPTLAKEWHLTRNGSLTPNDFTSGSGKKVWWICSKGHEWQAVVSDRNNGTGCPFCSGRLACADNCLQTVNPTLAKEWHLIKNGSLTPRDVKPYSAKKVWWICSKGHEWQAAIDNRSNGGGCPYCSNRKACKDNCLQTVYFELLKE